MRSSPLLEGPGVGVLCLIERRRACTAVARNDDLHWPARNALEDVGARLLALADAGLAAGASRLERRAARRDGAAAGV